MYQILMRINSKGCKRGRRKYQSITAILMDGSCDTTLRPTENGKQKKCVTVPHHAISAHFISKFDERGKIIIFVCIAVPLQLYNS